MITLIDQEKPETSESMKYPSCQSETPQDNDGNNPKGAFEPQINHQSQADN